MTELTNDATAACVEQHPIGPGRTSCPCGSLSLTEVTAPAVPYPLDQIEIDGTGSDRWFVRRQDGSLVLTCYPGGEQDRERTYLSFETFEKIAAAVEELKPR